MSTCKIQDCNEPFISLKGRYAKLCAAHRAERKVLGPVNSRKHSKNGKPQLQETAIRLVEISERIDKSAAQFHESRNHLLIDIQEFTRMLDSLKEDVKKIVNPNAN